ncbi:dephospho-CoA kinase [Flavobacteriaceae bacterium]|jgi:dephospho-CoA kinase|nr:dephospho-CoA kinase [Flavobacteriaceae bacterium]MDC0552326.1 dephospho-CoA kinase [Flavobacteriaceae bacterium]|tara:strand:- start:270 stop:848 length:579 start_codon:yes stop_codon:yes gene_type:complete
MKKVAITGGIGSGKTYISKMFSKLGVPIYNSDQKANSIIKSNIVVKKSIINAFGSDSFINNELNKKHISKIIFNNNSKLRLINSIVHPLVYEDYNNWLLGQKNSYTIYESAIIYENDTINNFDKIIGVISDNDLKISRLLSRGMAKLSITNIMKNQAVDTEIIRISDFLIYNNLNNDINKDVMRIHSNLLDD